MMNGIIYQFEKHKKRKKLKLIKLKVFVNRGFIEMIPGGMGEDPKKILCAQCD